ncbi:MAG: DUF11 domain-containing protein [Proteobacteria bacterium]|nr:DUF11 domain-containing protein [Pseudomonadota bacterium]
MYKRQVLTYRVPVLSSIPSGQITIPNSAQIAGYATTATNQANTESYLDVRCGEVRIDGAHFAVSGHVRITDTVTGIAGATVEISGSGISMTATADADGFYALTALPAGSYILTARTPLGQLIENRSISVTTQSLLDEDFSLDMAITVMKSFAPDSIEYGGTSILTITLTNTASELQATGLNFADIFPPGMTVAEGASISGTCGGTLAGVVGAGAISLSGGALAAGGSCELTVEVTSIKTGDNVISAGAGSDQTGPVGPSSNTATLVVGTQDPSCSTTSLQSSTTTMGVSAAELDRVIKQALSLRDRYVKAGYCSGAPATCVPCGKGADRCALACRKPLPREIAAVKSSSRGHMRRIARLTSQSLVTESWDLVCDKSKECSLVDMIPERSRVLAAGRTMIGLATRVLYDCCMHSTKAPRSWQRRRNALIRSSNQEYNRLVSAIASYPGNALVCE